MTCPKDNSWPLSIRFEENEEFLPYEDLGEDTEEFIYCKEHVAHVWLIPGHCPH